jgi:hypothetical protein
MDQTLDARGTNKSDSSTRRALLSAPTGNDLQVAPLQVTTIDTNAQVAERRATELRAALEHRKAQALTPLKWDEWLRLLSATGLLCKYPHIPTSLRYGFDAGIRPLTTTFAPPNNNTLLALPHVFTDIIDHEFQCGRYIGPLSRMETEELLGPFQTSPLSIVPKPDRPNMHRLIQNFSFPHSPTPEVSSVNHSIDSAAYPCTWGTFATVSLIIARLPVGSQAAVRDVAEAYRTIPLAPSQWPGIVVRLQESDSFAIDTCNGFGITSSAGVYGTVGDAGCDILRAHGMGPMSKWVDDHIFFRVPRPLLEDYNRQRAKWRDHIDTNGGRIHDGGRIWYRGDTMPDGRPEEFDEDLSATLLDLSTSSPRSAEDANYAYAATDIDSVCGQLGIPWEKSKDIPFGFSVPFIGFLWDLPSQTVSITDKKKAKYLVAIEKWEAQRTHKLAEVQKLYGKLLHASLIIPEGRAYLTSMEAMLGIFHSSPFLPRTPPRHTASDLLWWKEVLLRPVISRSIPGPRDLVDLDAFSDASSEIGIGITVGEKWRAWRLLPGWKRDGRDIGWAEAVGFELLVKAVTSSHSRGIHYKVFGDNRGVVEGWWKGRSKNRPTNEVFRRIHTITTASECTVHTRYVPSKLNPADDPSRGIYPDTRLLLPRIPIPRDLEGFVVDFDADEHPCEVRLRQEGIFPLPQPKPAWDDHSGDPEHGAFESGF